MGFPADAIIVPPAELEGVLLEHPDIVDVAVIGVVSEAEATELPRYAIHDNNTMRSAFDPFLLEHT